MRESREKAEYHRRWHHELLQWQQLLCEKRNAQPNETMLTLQSQLYLTTPNTRKGKPIEYGGKDIPIFRNYRQLKDFQI
jgi:SNF2 family DNA or RNA helicase